VDSNLQSPYDLIEDDGLLGYRFVTKDGITYHAYFLSVSYLHPLFENAYSFNIEPEGDIQTTRHAIDTRIAKTIVAILSRFFEQNENSMLMACDNLDGKEAKRRKLFDHWYSIYNNQKLVKLDASLENESYKLYMSMFIHKENPQLKALIDAFNEVIRTDLYELGI
jgi:hypothetical protein